MKSLLVVFTVVLSGKQSLLVNYRPTVPICVYILDSNAQHSRVLDPDEV